MAKNSLDSVHKIIEYFSLVDHLEGLNYCILMKSCFTVPGMNRDECRVKDLCNDIF